MGRYLRQPAFGLAILLTTLGAGAETCFVSVAHAQETTFVRMSAESVLTFGQLAGLDGVTFCIGKQVFSRVDPTLDSIMIHDVEVHEAKHREQFARFPSCEAWNAYYRTPNGKLQTEAEAYAAGYCEAKRRGYEDMEDLERHYLQDIYSLLGGGTGIYTILQTFKHYVTC